MAALALGAADKAAASPICILAGILFFPPVKNRLVRKYEKNFIDRRNLSTLINLIRVVIILLSICVVIFVLKENQEKESEDVGRSSEGITMIGNQK